MLGKLVNFTLSVKWVGGVSLVHYKENDVKWIVGGLEVSESILVH